MLRISYPHYNAASLAGAKHVLVDDLHVFTGQVAVNAAQTMQIEQAEASIYAFGVGCAVDRYGSLCLAGNMLAGVVLASSPQYAASAAELHYIPRHYAAGWH